VKKLVAAGKTGSQIAKAVGVSLPSVQNIKSALGMVKSRGAKKAARKKPAKRRRTKKPQAQKGPVAAPAASAAAEG
jgi:transposase